MDPKYPNITVQLTGLDGNAFAILGRCIQAMKDDGLDGAEIDAFTEQSMAGDYGDLLRTCDEWFEVY